MVLYQLNLSHGYDGPTAFVNWISPAHNNKMWVIVLIQLGSEIAHLSMSQNYTGLSKKICIQVLKPKLNLQMVDLNLVIEIFQCHSDVLNLSCQIRWYKRLILVFVCEKKNVSTNLSHLYPLIWRLRFNVIVTVKNLG